MIGGAFEAGGGVVEARFTTLRSVTVNIWVQIPPFPFLPTLNQSTLVLVPPPPSMTCLELGSPLSYKP